jgi:diphthine-ammonia ligase
MRLAVLFSGGKDSNYALYWTLNQGFDVTQLVTLNPRRDDSFMFHLPCLDYVSLQAESIGIPPLKKSVSGVKEDEVKELQHVLSKLDIDGVVSGAVASEYQKTRIDGICENLGIKSFAPLWHKKPEQLLYDIINAGFSVMVVGIAAEGLTEEWLSKILSLADVEELRKLNKKYGISIAGEGGEYETFVLDGPIYKRRIMVKSTVKKMLSKNAGILEIRDAVLSGKP